MRPKYQQPAQTFEQVDRPEIRFSGLDLSHRHTTSFDMGEVIPVALFECMPNDRWDLGMATVLRMQPLVAPILHPVKLKVQAWFCPNRLLVTKEYDAFDWEEFITGGPDGLSVQPLPLFNPFAWGATAAASGSLWDRFGYNPIFDASTTNVYPTCQPLELPHRMYTLLWNHWFRVPGIQAEVAIPGNLFRRPFFENWPRDYFTSALPFLQRGVSPSLPVLGSLSATTTLAYNLPWTDVGAATGHAVLGIDTGVNNQIGYNSGASALGDAKTNIDGAFTAGSSAATSVTANLSTVDTKQIRLAFLYQAFLEQMARGGARYAEMLPKIWGAKPLDFRLNRVEFIGGFTEPWLTSEVLQTGPQVDNGPGGDTPPQGNMAGHGLNLASGNIGRYRVDEHGYIMITVCTYPDSMYSQGMPRHALRRVREEFPSPSFAGLSEQEIFNAELFNQTIATDPTGTIGRTPFGYTGRYNEMRYQPSIVSADMKQLFDYWHLAREFTSLPPLNSSFINMENDNVASGFKRIFAVQNVPGIIGTFGIHANVTRAIPFMSVPASLGGA